MLQCCTTFDDDERGRSSCQRLISGLLTGHAFWSHSHHETMIPFRAFLEKWHIYPSSHSPVSGRRFRRQHFGHWFLATRGWASSTPGHQTKWETDLDDRQVLLDCVSGDLSRAWTIRNSTKRYQLKPRKLTLDTQTISLIPRIPKQHKKAKLHYTTHGPYPTPTSIAISLHLFHFILALAWRRGCFILLCVNFSVIYSIASDGWTDGLVGSHILYCLLLLLPLLVLYPWQRWWFIWNNDWLRYPNWFLIDFWLFGVRSTGWAVVWSDWGLRGIFQVLFIRIWLVCLASLFILCLHTNLHPFHLFAVSIIYSITKLALPYPDPYITYPHSRLQQFGFLS